MSVTGFGANVLVFATVIILSFCILSLGRRVWELFLDDPFMTVVFGVLWIALIWFMYYFCGTVLIEMATVRK